MRQEFDQPANGMPGNAGQNVLQPSERVDSVSLAGGYEAPQHCGGVAAVVATEKGPVVAADGHTSDGALGGVMPTPGLCRVNWILNAPHCLGMMADAA